MSIVTLWIGESLVLVCLQALWLMFARTARRQLSWHTTESEHIPLTDNHCTPGCLNEMCWGFFTQMSSIGWKIVTLSKTAWLATIQNFLLIISAHSHISYILLQQPIGLCLKNLIPSNMVRRWGFNNGRRQVWVHLSAPCTHPFSHFTSIE